MDTAIAVLTLLFTIGAFCAAMFQAYKQNMSDPASRQIYIDRLSSPRFERIYKSVLQRGLRAVDWAFGETRPFWPSGYVVCIGISFVYSVTGFIGAWSIGGPGHLGDTSLLPEDWSTYNRFYFTFVLFVACILLYQMSAHALVVARYVYLFFKRLILPPPKIRPLIACGWIVLQLVLIGWYTNDFLLVTAFAIISVALGVWMGSGVVVGGLVAGILAALATGLGSDGVHQFIAAILILAAVAVGGSRGTQSIAALYTRFYRRIRPSTYISSNTVDRFAPYIVFSLVGATGGIAFMAGLAGTYSVLLGPEVNSALLQVLGISTTSTIFLLVGAIAGLIGGALAVRLGRGAVFLSGFVSGILVIFIVGTAFGGERLFGHKSIVSAALTEMLLFFIILPPLNALWDWLAWEARQFLGRRILLGVTAKRVFYHTVSAFLIGVLLLLGLTWSATMAIEVFNQWMFRTTGTLPLPIGELVGPAIQEPLGADGIWITLMLFSTLVPTLCHFVFLLFGMWILITPKSARAILASQIANSKGAAELDLPAWYFTLLPVAGLAVTLFLMFVCFELFGFLGKPLSYLLYESVEACIAMVGRASASIAK